MKQENVQPKPSEVNTETSAIHQQQTTSLPAKQDEIPPTESTTSSPTTMNQPIKR